jgi:putative PEP-CTERM system TPR-repeat lipoprotein
MKFLIQPLFLASLLVACSQQSSDEYMMRAKAAIDKNDNDAAVIELKNAIRQAPDIAEARFLLGQVYLKQGAYKFAEKELAKALELNYPAEKVLPLLSKTYNKTGSAMALTKLQYKMKGLKPAEAAEVAYYKLKALIQLKQKLKAQALVEEIRGIDTSSPFKQLSQVLALMNNDDNTLALQQIDLIQQKHPKHAETLKLKAEIQLQTNQPEQALITLRDYHDLYPDDDESTFRFVYLLVAQEKSAEAEPYIDALMQKFANNPLLNQYKAVARFDAKDYQQALQYGETAIKQLPQESQLRLIAGYSAYFLKDYEKANQHLSLIVTELPPKHPALRMLAAAQLQLGLGLEATDTLAKMETTDEHDAFLYSSAGIALTKQGEIVKAKQLLEKSSALSNTPSALAQLGVLKLSLNDRSGIKNIESALADENIADNISYKNTLATAYLSTKAFDKALSLADSWLAKDQNDVQAYMLKGNVYKQQKAYKKAKNSFQQALKIKPENEAILLNIADTEFLQGNKAKAEKVYQQAVQKQPTLVPAWIRLFALNKEKGDVNSTIKALQQAVDANPSQVSLSLLLAKFYLVERQLDKAEAILSTFSSQTNPPKPYWPMMAEVYVQQKNQQQAAAIYRKWLAAEPKNRQAILGSLIMLDSVGKYQQALTMANEYLARVGSDAPVELITSHLLVMNNDFPAAKVLFAKLPEQLKQSPAANEVAGQIAIFDKNFKQAIEKLQLTYAERPTPRVTRLLALSYYANGEEAKSFKFLQQHTVKHPDDVPSWLLFANQQLAQNHQAAIPSYEHILTHQPDNLVALNNLAFLYFEQGNLDKAELHGQTALKLQPNNGYVLDTLAQIYLAKNDNKQALDLLTKAVNTKEANDEVYVNYIHALLVNDNKTLAERKIKQRKLTSPQAMSKLKTLQSTYQLKID